MGYYSGFPLAIPHLEARRNALLARSPLSPPKWFSFDLHALTMPPAFILSQDQTLQLNIVACRPEGRVCVEMKVCPASTTEVVDRSPQVSNNLWVSKSINLKGAHLSMSFEGLHEIDRLTRMAVKPSDQRDLYTADALLRADRAIVPPRHTLAAFPTAHLPKNSPFPASRRVDGVSRRRLAGERGKIAGGQRVSSGGGLISSQNPCTPPPPRAGDRSKPQRFKEFMRHPHRRPGRAIPRVSMGRE